MKKGIDTVTTPPRVVASWTRLEREARAVLFALLTAPDVSDTQRVKAVEIVLDRALGKPAPKPDDGGRDDLDTVEEWLRRHQSEGGWRL